MDTNEVFHDKFIRSGIIPYFTINNIRYYFMFIDKNYGTLIDGGGHIEIGENFICAATRELSEESLGIFSYSSIEVYENSQCTFDKNTILIFHEVKIENLEEALLYCKEFRRYFNNCIDNENCKRESLENSYLIYIKEDDLLDVCNGKNVELPNPLKQIFSKNVSLPTKNKYRMLINEFKNGLERYPNIYQLLIPLILDFINGD